MTQQQLDDDMTYSIIRYYRDHNGTDLIADGLTLEEAREHCRQADTRGEGWFDGYTLEGV